jgi:predicted NBD/HSP70 family sugar kinase
VNALLDRDRDIPPSRAGEVLHAVHVRPGITRSEVAAELGLSSGMASDVVASLVAAHQLTQGDPVATGGPGRPTRSLWPHLGGPLVAVAAIAHEEWRVEAIALGGEVVSAAGSRHDRDAPRVLGAVGDAFAALLDAHGDRLRAFAVSAPGSVSGTRLVQAANLGWQDVELDALRPRRAGELPLIAGNDATFSAIGELTRGAGAACASALHLFIDSGIGGALVDRGRVTTGAHGMAGEFGHMPFGSRRTLCRCGAHGCWNTELDGAALARVLDRPPPVDEVSFSREVLAAARAGAPDELAAVGAAAAALGRGAAGLVNATDPELVVLSGLAAEMLLAAPARLERAYREGLMQTIAADPPPLVAGALGDRGPLVGAMEAAFAPVLAHPVV